MKRSSALPVSLALIINNGKKAPKHCSSFIVFFFTLALLPLASVFRRFLSRSWNRFQPMAQQSPMDCSLAYQ